MPELKNIRQERFAYAVSRGRSQSDAYKEAGYKVLPTWKSTSAGKAASYLAKNVRVAARIVELRERWAEESSDALQITTTDVLRQLWQASLSLYTHLTLPTKA